MCFSTPDSQSFCFLCQVSPSIMKCETLWKHRLIIFGGSLSSWKPDIALGFECVCFRWTGEGSVWKVLPTCMAQMGPTSKGRGAVTLLSSMCIDGKQHHGYTSYSPSGVLIKEDEQKTIAGSLLPESQIVEYRLKRNRGLELLGTGKGWGWKIRKKEKYFIMLMKKREKSKHKYFWRRLLVAENLLRFGNLIT